MFFNRIIFLINVYFAFVLFFSCTKSNLGPSKYFSVTKMVVFPSKHYPPVVPHRPYSPYPENLRFDEFYLSLDFNDSILYYSQSVSTDQDVFNPFISTAYAELINAHGEGYLGSQEKIESIVITSNKAFDKNYAAGDTLNELFNVSLVLDSVQYLPQKQLAFSLNSPPTKHEEHVFRVDYRQTNGLYLTETARVKFKM